MKYLSNALLSFAIFSSAGCLAVGMADADITAITPRGEYARIDTKLANDAIQVLLKGTSTEQEQTVKDIRAKPENYAPPVFYVLSNFLFNDGNREEGAFWFYAGQLRARIDANICADQTAKEAVGSLNNKFGPLINKYTFQDPNKLETLVKIVVRWERETPYQYDRRWINLHGMHAVLAGLAPENKTTAAPMFSYPTSQWKEIAEKTRVDYLRDFNEAMLDLKRRNAQ